MTTTATRQHELSDDIKRVIAFRAHQDVNRRGEPISPAVVVESSEKPIGYICLPCDATFTTWKAAEAHLNEPVRSKE